MSSASDRLSAWVILPALLAATVAVGSAEKRNSAPAGAGPAPAEPLRVCADPNNLPFSNDRGEGFENALAQMIAREMDRPLAYAWWPQRRGFIRNTVKAGKCDLVMGVPDHFEMLQVTEPYYRSSFVFITRRRDGLDIGSFDDPRLRRLDIGVHVIGDDYSNPPPVMALAVRGIRENVHGYSIYGDYSREAPTRNLIDALEGGAIDVAIAWGPLAGYFADQAAVPLDVTPLDHGAGNTPEPMTFGIAAGVAHGNDELRDAVQKILRRNREEVREVLRQYRVPVLEPAADTQRRTAGRPS